MSEQDLPDNVTVCLRVERRTIRHSEVRECRVCGHDVAVSPATVEEIDRGVYPEYIVCLECATEHGR